MVMLIIEREKWCMLNYYAWSTTVCHVAWSSEDGLQGFTDPQWVKWVREKVLPYIDLTTPMYGQIVPGLFNHLNSVIEEDPEEDPEEDSKKDPELMEQDPQEGS